MLTREVCFHVKLVVGVLTNKADKLAVHAMPIVGTFIRVWEAQVSLILADVLAQRATMAAAA